METAKTSLAYIGLGSNLDDPPRQIRNAMRALDRLHGSRIVEDSGLFLSRPMEPPEGPIAQADFYNAVVKIETVMEPLELLDHLQQIENTQHRTRDQRWGPRTIDLDILMFDNLQMNTERLTLPHPGIQQREFVLYPLQRIDDSLEIPGRGMLKQLIAHCPQNGLQYLGNIEGFEE